MKILESLENLRKKGIKFNSFVSGCFLHFPIKQTQLEYRKKQQLQIGMTVKRYKELFYTALRTNTLTSCNNMDDLNFERQT